jgi:hypothetical protein
MTDGLFIPVSHGFSATLGNEVRSITEERQLRLSPIDHWVFLKGGQSNSGKIKGG